MSDGSLPLSQTFLILLIAFQFKHFVADFLLQNVYMLRKSSPGWDFALPLASHCFLHALMTLGIAYAVRPSLWWLAVVDFVVHFFMDRIKAGPLYLGRYKDARKKTYWVAYGFDQMVHHLTHIAIAWFLVFGL